MPAENLRITAGIQSAIIYMSRLTYDNAASGQLAPMAWQENPATRQGSPLDPFAAVFAGGLVTRDVESTMTSSPHRLWVIGD